MLSVPSIEILWWEGCPSTEPARALLRSALDEFGHSDIEIRMVEVVSDDQAHSLGFRGSPTIRFDGVDLVTLAGADDPSGDAPAALSCRLYRRRDGRISPTPDPADVRAAVALLAEGARP